jgi:hypothetical protein
MNSERKKLLEKAEERIFSLGLRDLASAMSYKNMRYGLGKMLHVAENAYCVLGPDSTITRNAGRWLSGFGYGAVIRWEPEGLFFPEIRPNGCGMILVKLDELPSRESILERISEIETSKLMLNGTRIKPDFGKGNHFFEFYSVMRVLPELESIISRDCYYALLHGSASERKNEIYGMINEGEWVETPLGKISVLDGDLGREYYRKWKEFENFSMRRRELLAKELLPECEIISSLNHQGMFSKGEIRLGCHDTMDKHYPKGKALFPIALRWDHPLYLFQGKQNLSEDVLGMLGFSKRAKKLGIFDELKNTNILPHGGGYTIKLPYTRLEVMKTEIGNNFIMSGVQPVSKVEEMIVDDKVGLSKFGEMIVTNPHDLPYDYRGMKVIEKTLEYDLATPVAMLQPLMTIKI